MWSQPLPKKVFRKSLFRGYWCDTTPALHIHETQKPDVGPLPRTRSDGHVPSPRSTITIMLPLRISWYQDNWCSTYPMLQLSNPKMSRYELNGSMTLVNLDSMDTIPHGILNADATSLPQQVLLDLSVQRLFLISLEPKWLFDSQLESSHL